MTGLQSALLEWYRQNRRDLPWRRTADPYAVWVSEAMLQQTRVSVVLEYWERWMERFPSIEALAAADDQDVLSAWQGLGYYRRCRSLLAGAREVAEGGMPGSAETWERIPGIGRYTAGAIASIAQGEACPVVDGNVERVFARLTENPLAGPALTKSAWRWAEANLAAEEPGTWNQALMELGATVCTVVNPRCDACPLTSYCNAYRGRTQADFPRRTPKPPPNRLIQCSIVPCHGERYGLRQIPNGEWWAGMWEFPRSVDNDTAALSAEWDLQSMRKIGVVRHTVTNNRIELHVHMAEVANEGSDLVWHSPEELNRRPLPAPQRRAYELAQRVIHTGG